MSAASPNDTRGERFLGLSELLTGFDRVALLGTGMADAYLGALDQIVSPAVVDEVLAAYAHLPSGPDREAAAGSTILADPKIGPVARNLILVWYSGAWTELPETWRAAFGASKDDGDKVISGPAYQAGLQWSVIGAHPAGARAQGFGSWASPPMAV